MKQFRFLPLIVMTFSLIFSSANAQDETSKSNNITNKLEVRSFHSTNRCMTCNAIEANTEYTLNTYFSEELKSGKINFQTLNVDKEANYKTAEKFEAAGTSLFFNVCKDGKESIINISNFAFSKGRDKEAFSKELKEKIEEQLKKL